MPQVGLPGAPTWNLCPSWPWPALAAQHCAPGPQEAGPAGLPSLPPDSTRWPRGPGPARRSALLRSTAGRPSVRAGGREALPHRGLCGLGPSACARPVRLHPQFCHSPRSNKGKGENQKGFKPKPQSLEGKGVLCWFSFCSKFLGPPS